MQELQLNSASSPASHSDLRELHRPRPTDFDRPHGANRECPPTNSEFNRFHDKVLKNIEKNSNAIDKHFDKGNPLEIVDDKNDKKDLSISLSKDESKDKSKDKSLEIEGMLSKEKTHKDKSVDAEGSLSKDKSKDKSIDAEGSLSKDKSKDKSIDAEGSLSKDKSGGPSRESSDGGASRGRQR